MLAQVTDQTNAGVTASFISSQLVTLTCCFLQLHNSYITRVHMHKHHLEHFFFFSQPWHHEQNCKPSRNLTWNNQTHSCHKHTADETNTQTRLIWPEKSNVTFDNQGILNDCSLLAHETPCTRENSYAIGNKCEPRDYSCRAFHE